MLGFRMAYDWYLQAKKEEKRRSPQFQQTRSKLSFVFSDYIYPEFAAHRRLMKKLELARTIRSLKRGIVSTIDRGDYYTQLEMQLLGSRQNRISEREVI